MTKLYLITGFLGAGKTTFLQKFTRLFPDRKIAQDISLQKLTLTVSGFDRKSLESFLRMFAENTYRIKGFAELDGEVCAADCVGPLVEVRPFAGEPSELGRLVVLFGHGLPARKSIREAIRRFPGCDAAITVP